MKNLKVSIIIPVYNGEKTLKNCLNSVLNQTYKNYEILVVDNNSNDKTKKIIKEFEKKDKKIKYIFEKKTGRGSARNAGINTANSEIIAMTDSDCIVPNNWIEKLIYPIINENETAVMGSEEDIIKNFWTKQTQKIREICLKESIENFEKKDYIQTLDTKNFAIKKDIIKKIKFDSNLIWCEDIDFYIKLKKYVKIRFLKDIQVKHYHKHSITEVIKSNFLKAYWIAIIQNKYKKNKKIRKYPLCNFLSLKNNLLFPFWLGLLFFREPFKDFYSRFIIETSWRVGGIIGLLKNKF